MGPKTLARACPEPQDRDVIEEQAIRALATRRSTPAVTSFYLDVDGRRYPRPSDYAPNVDHLFRLARKSAEAQGKDVVEAVESDLSRIGEWLDGSLDRSTTRGVALFSGSREGFFEAFGLPVPVRDQVVVGPGPDVAPLCSVSAASERTLVVAVDAQRARFLRIRPGQVEEVEAPTDEIERQVDTDVELGSFERRHEEHARQHYRHVARAMVDELGRRPATHVVLSGTREAVAHLEEHLPKGVARLVAGRIGNPLASERGDLARAATEVVDEARRQHRTALGEELRDRAEQGAAAVTGLGATLRALGADQVETLIVEEAFATGGAQCGECGQLVVDAARCPRCGATPVWVDNVVDAAITDALAHHVAIEFCEPGGLADLGHIGAFEHRRAAGET